MKITVTDKELSVKQNSKIWNKIVVFILGVIYIGQLIYIFSHLNEIKFDFWGISSLVTIESVFSYLYFRVVYFALIDKNVFLVKNADHFTDAKKKYLLNNVKSIYITEYGNRIMSNTFHIYIKMSDSNKIPIAIGVDDQLMKKVLSALTTFFNIDVIERKKYILNI